MAPKLPGLSSLKLAQLKRVAVATGINSSGTKTDLTTRLLTELQNSHDASSAKLNHAPTKAQGQRIVSIDMGIRNLAYCVLAVPSTPNSKIPPKKPSTTPPLPVVEAWTRIAVSGKTSPAPNREASNAQDQTASQGTATATTTATSQAKVKETFDPATYAQHAYALISSLLHTHRPSTILIERQRYRSMGAAAVQEWTLRVNMFEAMLHAVLETLGREGRWVGDVWAVSPGKVASFWVGDGGGEGKGRGKGKGKGKGKGDGEIEDIAKKKRGNKGVKIDVVGGWLVGGGVVRLQGQAEGMGRAFMRRWRAGGRKRGVVVVESKSEDGDDAPETVEAGIGKLDDLADCLLQGVAWVKWQENRRLLVKGGVDSLDGLD